MRTANQAMRHRGNSIGWLAGLLMASFGLYALVSALTPRNHGVDSDFFDEAAEAHTSLSKILQVSTATAARPNIIVILADDLGYGDMAVYGNRVIATPSLDQLASEGKRFTDFYASAPLCSPSRAGLLTGRYPLRSGIMTAMQAANDTPMRSLIYRLGVVMSHLAAVDMLGGTNAVRGLPASEITIAEARQGAGYRTMAVGKWHLAAALSNPPRSRRVL